MKKKLFFLSILTFICNISIAQYFIIFRANPATSLKEPGHAFASFVKKDKSLNQTVIEHTWGFHPSEKSVKALFPPKER